MRSGEGCWACKVGTTETASLGPCELHGHVRVLSARKGSWHVVSAQKALAGVVINMLLSQNDKQTFLGYSVPFAVCPGPMS